MHNRFRRISTFVPALALVAALGLSARSAEAQTRPFHITGEGFATQGLPLPGQPARPHWAVGEASYLGAYYGEGTVETNTAVPQPNGNIDGLFKSGQPFVFTNAHGEKLVTNYGQTAAGDPIGTFELIPVPGAGIGFYRANFIATFVIDGAQSTGRFAGAKGSWKMYAYTVPFPLGSTVSTYYWWHGTGTIAFH